MKTTEEKIGTVLVYICLVLIVLVSISIFPYKEVLECKDNNCTVERSYVLFNYRDGSSYSFSKTDNIQTTYHHSSGRFNCWFYGIENLSDYNFSIFDNMFAGKKTPEKLIEKIKSSDSHIKITKYWFGYKIEK